MYLLAFALLMPPTRPPAPPPYMVDILYIHDVLNDKCRDGEGGAPETVHACDVRDRLYKKIVAAGWCWGHAGQFENEKDWEPCEAKESRPK